MEQPIDARTAWVKRFLDGERYRFRPVAAEREGWLTLKDGLACRVEAPDEPMLAQMRADFERWCERCLGISGSGDGPGVTWRLVDPLPLPVDPTDRRRERFELEVTAAGATVTARHPRGLLAGMHQLIWQLGEHGALRLGRELYEPAFTPRIGNGIFIHSDQKIRDYDQFSDEYLALYSQYGNNGIHLHLRLSELWRSTTLPELDSPDFEAKTAELRAACKRLATFGVDLYVYLLSLPLRGDHPLFAANPRRRGAAADPTCWGGGHNLCVSSPEVLDGYAEAVTAIFEAVPELAGAVIIVGGEGLVHCYTRPAPTASGYTNCPHCRNTPPSRPIANLVNRLAAAVKATGRHKPVFAWPYSAFIWSGEDRHQEEWLRALSPDVFLQANFATNGADPTTGSGAYLYDYNIKQIEASPVYAAQAAVCREQGRPYFVKIESTTTPDAFFLPYLPFHQRWGRRFEAMRELGVSGGMIQWRFYGFNAAPSEELFYRATWEPERSVESVLAAMARRDFGLAGADRVVRAWQRLSEAYDDFPYSALTAGERDFYMRGPFYLGPAHPLIFDPSKSYDLLPVFRGLMGCFLEGGVPDNLEELLRNAPPRYVSDLTLTMPFGVERYLELIGRCRSRWEAGLALLREVLGPLADAADDALAGQSTPSVRARLELDVAEAFGIHLATLEHTVRFYATRDELWREPLTPARLGELLRRLTAIARDEMANAERALPILDRDPRIGYGHSYGPVYDRAMVEDKLRQCRYVVETELPAYDRLMRFHIWNEVERNGR